MVIYIHILAVSGMADRVSRFVLYITVSVVILSDVSDTKSPSELTYSI